MYNTEMLLERLAVINARCKRLGVDGCTGPSVIAEADRCALQFAVDEIKDLEAIVDKVRAELEGPGELFDCVQEIRNVLTKAAAQAAKENK